MVRFTGPDSLSARAAKPFLAIALTIAALFASASIATAAPAKTGTVSATGANATPPVFNCSYYSQVPFHDVAVGCAVGAGVVRVYLLCSDNSRIDGPAMYAGYVYRFVLSCPGVPMRTISWESLD